MRGTKKDKWTAKDVERLTGNRPQPHDRAVKIPKPEAKGLVFIKNYLRMLNVDFVCEHRFHPDRRWRFDVAIAHMKLGVEYEGIFSEISRHTSMGGYTRDVQKYNEAQKIGWTVLRYTANNYEDFPKDLEDIKENDKNGLFN